MSGGLSVEIAHALARSPGRGGAFALDIRFEAPAEGVTALFGPSGSGKTSCANAVAGLLRPDAGRIALGEEVLFDAARRRHLPPRRRGIGYVFQEARLFPHLTVAANLDYGARRSPRAPGAAERGRIVEMLGIGGLLARRPAGLSGGERSRVALGRALMSGPRLMLLDEPLAALDAGRKAEILPYLERLRDETGVPILHISHSLDEVTRLADRMVVLNAGRVAATGSVEEIMARLDLFPLTGRFEAGAVIAGRVEAADAGMQLSAVGFAGGRLLVPRIAAAPGTPVRLRVRARDVLLAVQRPQGLSARNILAVRIAEIRAEDGPYADIRLDCAGTPILARITQAAVAELGLAPGRMVWAVIKTVSIARASGSGARGRAG
ncbi:molybdenum ABC transporter ATP-binding protein [Paralimibaculum aggregatum]|uniref:Molybdenum ABC transporter ATP-binding protein n=2 Tax=Paralimibaculum aggregatum TaxID=3036245 RepID=A0ABQ6LMQ8_9RHOB|nr:molybdenum ABC transporter ATP-binding protein [Limibaculum sp. NKW23]